MPSPTLTNVSRPKAYGFGAALGERLFRLAVGPGRTLTVENAEMSPPKVDTTSSPEEASSQFGNVFARSRWSGGGGLFRAHIEGADPSRYWDSRNVDVSPADPGEFPELTLLKATEIVEASADTNLRVTSDGASVWMAEGQNIRRSDDPLAVSPAFSDDDPHDGETATTVFGVAVLGDEVYAALGANGIHKKSSGSWAHWSDLAATRIWSVKGRIVAAIDNAIYEVVAAGAAPSALKTLPSGVVWTDVADGGEVVLASADDGYVYAFTDNAGTLELTGQTLFEGEQPMCVGGSQGVITVGTKQATSSGEIGRWYRGVVENGQIGNLQLLKQWGGADTTTDESPRKIIGTRDSVFTAVTDGTDTYLWRLDLRTGGVSRHLTVADAGLALGLATVGNVLFASVSESGLWRQDSTYATSGYLIGPLGDFYSSAAKSWVEAMVETGTIDNGQRVELFYTTDPNALADADSAAWIRVRSLSSGSGRSATTLSVVSRSLAGMVKLYPSSDEASSPVVRSFAFRSYPTDPDLIVTLPVNVSDQIERRGRHRKRVPGLGQRTWQDLSDLEGESLVCIVYPLDLTVQGLVESVGSPIQGLTRRGSATVFAQVRVRGKRVGAMGTSTSGPGPFGTYHLFGTEPEFGSVA